MNELGITMSSEKDTWLTPPLIWKKAIAVMGGIDLDPCSNSTYPYNIPAYRHIEKEEDALSQLWTVQDQPSRVFMNPPYNKHQDQRRFARKLDEEFAASRVSQAIILIASRTETGWFRKWSQYPRCFIWGRLRFLDAVTREEIGPATFPSVVFGLGVDVSLFEWVFRDIGDTFVSLKDFTGITSRDS